MSKKILTIQDISCYGQCSVTVALPILSAYGVETAILPSAVLSTHTSGFKDFTVLDLTSEMPKIVAHWIAEGIRFDAIYTGYIGDARQFDLILECKDKLLKEGGLFIVDPAMADHGKLYPALNRGIVDGMKRICAVADYVIPNITEACLLTDTPYREDISHADIEALLDKLVGLGARHAIISGVSFKADMLGAVAFDGNTTDEYFTQKQEKSYHGTGDIFSSIIVAHILRGEGMDEILPAAVEFIVECIKATADDPAHGYGVKFEDVLARAIK